MKPKMIVVAGLILWGCSLFGQPLSSQPPAQPPAQSVTESPHVAKPLGSTRPADAGGSPTGHRYNDPSAEIRSATEVLAEIRLLPKVSQDDLAAIKRLAAGIEKDAACPAEDCENIRYFTLLAHQRHLLMPIGFVDHGCDPRRPPKSRFYREFHYDAAGRLVALVEHTEKGERCLTDRLIYEGDNIIARLSFSPKGFEFGDYGVWHGGKLRMTGRVMADSKLASYECIFWMGDREDYSVRYAGWDRPEPDKIPLQSINFSTVRIEVKPDGAIDKIYHYSYDTYREPAPNRLP